MKTRKPLTEGRGGRPDLPTKVCPTCGRAFAWRKKWERDWPNVKYCSKRCAAGKSTHV
ncbi:MAG: DUF2256 domain-containing protein [Planctomycetota bacterium]